MPPKSTLTPQDEELKSACVVGNALLHQFKAKLLKTAQSSLKLGEKFAAFQHYFDLAFGAYSDLLKNGATCEDEGAVKVALDFYRELVKSSQNYIDMLDQKNSQYKEAAEDLKVKVEQTKDQLNRALKAALVAKSEPASTPMPDNLGEQILISLQKIGLDEDRLRVLTPQVLYDLEVLESEQTVLNEVLRLIKELGRKVGQCCDQPGPSQLYELGIYFSWINYLLSNHSLPMNEGVWWIELLKYSKQYEALLEKNEFDFHTDCHLKILKINNNLKPAGVTSEALKLYKASYVLVKFGSRAEYLQHESGLKEKPRLIIDMFDKAFKCSDEIMADYQVGRDCGDLLDMLKNLYEKMSEVLNSESLFEGMQSAEIIKNHVNKALLRYEDLRAWEDKLADILEVAGEGYDKLLFAMDGAWKIAAHVESNAQPGFDQLFKEFHRFLKTIDKVGAVNFASNPAEDKGAELLIKTKISLCIVFHYLERYSHDFREGVHHTHADCINKIEKLWVELFGNRDVSEGRQYLDEIIEKHNIGFSQVRLLIEAFTDNKKADPSSNLPDGSVSAAEVSVAGGSLASSNASDEGSEEDKSAGNEGQVEEKPKYSCQEMLIKVRTAFRDRCYKLANTNLAELGRGILTGAVKASESEKEQISAIKLKIDEALVESIGEVSSPRPAKKHEENKGKPEADKKPKLGQRLVYEKTKLLVHFYLVPCDDERFDQLALRIIKLSKLELGTQRYKNLLSKIQAENEGLTRHQAKLFDSAEREELTGLYKEYSFAEVGDQGLKNVAEMTIKLSALDKRLEEDELDKNLINKVSQEAGERLGKSKEKLAKRKAKHLGEKYAKAVDDQLAKYKNKFYLIESDGKCFVRLSDLLLSKFILIDEEESIETVNSQISGVLAELRAAHQSIKNKEIKRLRENHLEILKAENKDVKYIQTLLGNLSSILACKDYFSQYRQYFSVKFYENKMRFLGEEIAKKIIKLAKAQILSQAPDQVVDEALQSLLTDCANEVIAEATQVDQGVDAYVTALIDEIIAEFSAGIALSVFFEENHQVRAEIDALKAAIYKKYSAELQKKYRNVGVSAQAMDDLLSLLCAREYDASREPPPGFAKADHLRGLDEQIASAKLNVCKEIYNTGVRLYNNQSSEASMHYFEQAKRLLGEQAKTDDPIDLNAQLFYLHVINGFVGMLISTVNQHQASDLQVRCDVWTFATKLMQSCREDLNALPESHSDACHVSKLNISNNVSSFYGNAIQFKRIAKASNIENPDFNNALLSLGRQIHG